MFTMLLRIILILTIGLVEKRSPHDIAVAIAWVLVSFGREVRTSARRAWYWTIPALKALAVFACRLIVR